MFTTDELRVHFGNEIPIEAVNVLMDVNNAGLDKSVMIDLITKSIADAKTNWVEFVKDPYIKDALEFAIRYNWAEDNSEHKSFIIDQMVRLLLGHESDHGVLYRKFVSAFDKEWEGGDSTWNCGEES